MEISGVKFSEFGRQAFHGNLGSTKQKILRSFTDAISPKTQNEYHENACVNKVVCKIT